MTTILLADDHALVRDLLTSFIEGSTEYEVVQATDYGEAMQRVKDRGPFDLVLLDYDMPGMDGLNGILNVVEASGEKPVALLSGAVSQNIAEAAIEHGAKGIIPKTLHLRSMVAAIDFMLAGETYAPYQFNAQPQPKGDVALTSRENEVLKALCDGKSNKEIARELELHETTVKMHVRGLSRKLGAKNRTHAAMLAIEKRLI